MEKITLKQSYINMAELIKKSKGAFFIAFILILIPVLIINCYSFYAIYGGTGLNYSAVENIDFDSMLTGSTDAVMQFQEAMYNILPETDYKQSFGDVFLDIISTLAIIVFDAFVTLFAVNFIFEKENKSSEVFNASLKNIPAMLFFSILASWIILEVQSIVASSVFMFFASLKTVNLLFIYSSVASMLMLTVCGIFLATWILLFVRYMTISYVSGRCRFMLAFGYAREVLRGRIWKNMFKIMPFIISGFILPVFMQSVAIAFGYKLMFSIGLVLISVVIEMLVFMLWWIYTVPEFFYQEKVSGIQKKIHDMIMQAMNMRKNQQTEDNKSEDEKE